MNEIICGEALNELKKLSDNSIDLIVTDPPYNISNNGKKIDRTAINCRSLKRNGLKSKELNYDFGEWDKFKTREDYLKFIEDIGKELYRIGKDNCSLFLWCPKSDVSYIEERLRNNGWYIRSTLVWCKTNPVPMIFRVGFMSGTEFCVFATKHKGRKHIWNTKYGQQLNYFIRSIVMGKERTIHPTQKPLDITKKFIQLTTNEGHTVLDCFLGSGTTAVACKELNRNFIGIEINPEYCKIAEQRLRNIPEKLNSFIEDNKNVVDKRNI